MARSKDNHFKIFTQILQDLFGIRADIDPSLNSFSGRKFDWKFDSIGRIQAVVTMDQSLIKVKDYCFFI
jgi:hypothetical protein